MASKKSTCHKKKYLAYCNWHTLLHLPTMLAVMIANVFKLDVAFLALSAF